MRKIEQEIVQAIKQAKDLKRGDRDRVEVEPDRIVYRLWGSPTVIVDRTTGTVTLNVKDHHKSPTTKSRINGILYGLGFAERVSQHKFEWFVGTFGGQVPFFDGIRVHTALGVLA